MPRTWPRLPPTHDLIHDAWLHAVYFTLFVYGYWLGVDAGLWAALRRLRESGTPEQVAQCITETGIDAGGESMRFDAIVYATTVKHGAELLTCDAHFKGLPGAVLFPKAAVR